MAAPSGSSAAIGGSCATRRRTSSGCAATRNSELTAAPDVAKKSTGPAPSASTRACRSSACCSGVTAAVSSSRVLRPTLRGSVSTMTRSTPPDRARRRGCSNPVLSIGEPPRTSGGDVGGRVGEVADHGVGEDGPGNGHGARRDGSLRSWAQCRIGPRTSATVPKLVPMTDFSDQDLSGSGFQRVDLSGSTFRQADMTDLDVREVNLSGTRVRAAYFDGVRMTGIEVPDMEISGEIVRLVVNGVDVVPLVEAELNRQMPERALMAPTTVDGFREAFAIIDRLWGETMGRARKLAAGAALRAGRRRVVVHRDPAPPRLRARLLGRGRRPRPALAVAPPRPPVGRGTRVRGRPVGAEGAPGAARGDGPAPAAAVDRRGGARRAHRRRPVPAGHLGHASS